MSRSVNPELKERIASLTAEGDRTLSARELADVIGEVARSLTADLRPLSTQASPEYSVQLAAAPAEAADAHDRDSALAAMARIGTVDQGEGPLSIIAHDLEEIRSATQEAASKFLSCAEAIEEISDQPDLDPDDQVALTRLSTDMFEASSFQDLAGQRLTRIGEYLRQIEYLVASTKAALGDDTAAVDAEELAHAVEETEHRKMEYKLHGPDDAGTANTQEEIDKILASFD